MSGVKFLDRVRSLQFSKILVALIIAFGTLARVAQYLSNRSLWLDEAMLALNIVTRPVSNLVLPLEYDQAAPIGFLVLEKWATMIFGRTEYALRLVPLVAGISALLLFYPFAKMFVARTAAIVALGLFAILDTLIYYSSEVKQYSSDVTIAIFIFWLAIRTEQNGWRTPWQILFASVSAIAVWFSYPAAFVVAGIFTVLIVTRISQKDYSAGYKLFAALALSIASLAFLYFTSLQTIRSNPTLAAVWQRSFMPFPPRSISEARWLLDNFLEIFNNPIGLSLSGLGAFLCLFGGVEIFARDKQKFFLLIAPVVLTLLASAIHAYPFSDRLILFLVPIALIFIGEGVIHLGGSTSKTSLIVQGIVVGLLIFQPLISAGKHVLQPRTAEEIKPALAFISEHRESQDVIYIYYSAQYAFQFYAQDYGLAEKFVVGKEYRSAPENYANDLKQLSGSTRVWVLFSHVYNWQGTNEQVVLLNYLDRMGVQRDSFSTPGAVVYLYYLN